MTENSFDELVKSTVGETLSRILGSDVWKAISFYFDVKTVSTDPDSFGKVLEKMFGSTSKVLKQVIGQTLVTKTGGHVDQKREREFQEWIQIAKMRFANLLSGRPQSMANTAQAPNNL